MNGYYPQVIQAILEFQAIIDAESSEIERVKTTNDEVLTNAYLTTMGEKRITQWENMLGIIPIEGSSVDDRRDTVVARIRGQGKLNTQLINTIVNTFTGGSAISYIKDSVLYVEITPPPNNKTYQFHNVERELKNKIPAHLGLLVSRNYYDWKDVSSEHSTWQSVLDNFDSWTEVLLYEPFS